jgi:hypothetical protein
VASSAAVSVRAAVSRYGGVGKKVPVAPRATASSSVGGNIRMEGCPASGGGSADAPGGSGTVSEACQ